MSALADINHSYVSVFKATWSSNPDVHPYFTVGNMGRGRQKKGVDVYDREGRHIRSFTDGLSNVPAVTCGHSSQPTIFAAGGESHALLNDMER